MEGLIVIGVFVLLVASLTVLIVRANSRMWFNVGTRSPVMEKMINDILDIGNYWAEVDGRVHAEKDGAKINMKAVTDYHHIDGGCWILVEAVAGDESWTTKVYGKEIWYKLQHAASSYFEKQAKQSEEAQRSKVAAVLRKVIEE